MRQLPTVHFVDKSCPLRQELESAENNRREVTRLCGRQVALAEFLVVESDCEVGNKAKVLRLLRRRRQHDVVLSVATLLRRLLSGGHPPRLLKVGTALNVRQKRDLHVSVQRHDRELLEQLSESLEADLLVFVDIRLALNAVHKKETKGHHLQHDVFLLGSDVQVLFVNIRAEIDDIGKYLVVSGNAFQLVLERCCDLVLIGKEHSEASHALILQDLVLPGLCARLEKARRTLEHGKVVVETGLHILQRIEHAKHVHHPPQRQQKGLRYVVLATLRDRQRLDLLAEGLHGMLLERVKLAQLADLGIENFDSALVQFNLVGLVLALNLWDGSRAATPRIQKCLVILSVFKNRVEISLCARLLEKLAHGTNKRISIVKVGIHRHFILDCD
eukprot:Opistho-2@59638